MTRIIAGLAGSLPLAVPDAGTRPTSDRVRESLFGALESARPFVGLRVVDLYAGSGALGLEAVSRGAESLDLVERSPRAAAVVERNVRTVLRAASHAIVKVHRTSADGFLRGAHGEYDLAFVDPPYDLAEDEISTTLSHLAPLMAPDGLVIVERASRSPEPAASGLVVGRSKRYGDTRLWWLETD